jgi:hypothetical protein
MHTCQRDSNQDDQVEEEPVLPRIARRHVTHRGYCQGYATERSSQVVGELALLRYFPTQKSPPRHRGDQQRQSKEDYQTCGAYHHENAGAAIHILLRLGTKVRGGWNVTSYRVADQVWL